MKKFIHLKVQSGYSLLESIVRIDDLVDLACLNKMPALGLVDKGNMFGALEFSEKASKKGIQPIHGTIVKVHFLNNKKHISELVLIAKNDIGYQNLLHLVSEFCVTENHTSLPFSEIEKCKSGLIILSGYTKGLIGKLVLENRYSLAIELASKMQSTFGDNFYFEISRHGFKDECIETQYLQIARDLQIPVVATNEVLFLHKDMHDIHEIFLRIQHFSPDEKKVLYAKNSYFKTEEEMEKLFYDLPEALENSVLIAKRCSVRATTRDPILPSFQDNVDEKEIIKTLSRDGLVHRLSKITPDKANLLSDNKQYFERLEYELSVICEMGFAGYFLIISDLVQWAKKEGIPVGIGRGSGVGSVVAWSLLITDLDPIEFGLIFERFLNPHRISMPDFDIDFCQNKREKVIQYVQNKYGKKRVAHIITFGSLQAKAAIKDIARVLGLDFHIANKITEFIPFSAVNPVTLKKAIEKIPQLQSLYKGKIVKEINIEDDEAHEVSELIEKTLKISLAIEGLPRHISTHAAGIIIAGIDLVQIVPLYKSPHDDAILVQYSMKYAELSGLVKFDFLGLQTLTMISDCCKLLETRGVEIDISSINLKDKKTYDMLSKGKSMGVFQFESFGMRDNLTKLIPDKVEDLMALSSLYRPGPMEHIATYIACKFGNQKPSYMHPLLKPILEPTYGVIIYQEQVIEIAKAFAGYTAAKADLLRRAIGKKIASEMKKQEKEFTQGAVKNGIDISIANDVFSLIVKFAGYGFNKSHAAAYSVMSYQTAYLKAHYPREFFVSFLNLELRDFVKVNLLISEFKEIGYNVIKPDINSSVAYFSLSEKDDKSIITGLGLVKGTGIGIVQKIVSERQKSGQFTSISDFVYRMSDKDLSKKAIEGLILSGCFDSLHPDRYQLYHNLDRIMSHMYSMYNKKSGIQTSFNALDTKILTLEKQRITEDIFSRLYDELEYTGIFLSGHPASEYFSFLEEKRIRPFTFVKTLQDGIHYVNLAVVILKKDVRSSNRGVFANLIVSDPTSTFEVSIFNENLLRDVSHKLQLKTAVILKCEIYKSDNSMRITVAGVELCDDILQTRQHTINLSVNNTEELLNCINLLKNCPYKEQGNVQVVFFLKTEFGLDAKVALPMLFEMKYANIRALQPFSIKR
ncbi:DNA polymerase III subunit alpha [Candidatus Sneabacter namystus]|nr:DNA polymerase III subunit alpha [Candidatus Sneabacter namystus]